MILGFLKRKPTTDNVIDINANEPHEVAELICVRCLYRYEEFYE